MSYVLPAQTPWSLVNALVLPLSVSICMRIRSSRVIASLSQCIMSVNASSTETLFDLIWELGWAGVL